MMEFNQENMRMRLKGLVEEFGSNSALAEACGMHKTTVGKYLNGKNKMRRKTWEKHFGPWDQDATSMETDETVEPEQVKIEEVKTTEPIAEQVEEPKSGFYVKAKSLAELKDILASLGMRLVVVNK